MIVFSSLVFAEDTGYSCFDEVDCADQGLEDAYCDLETFTCILEETNPDNPETGDTTLISGNQTLNSTEDPLTETNLTETPAPETSTVQSLAIESLQLSYSTLLNQSAQTEERLTNLEAAALNLQQQINDLSLAYNDVVTSLQSTNSQQVQIKETLQKDLNTFSTGLASLQEDLETTNEEIETIEEKVEKEESFSSMISIIFFILLAIAVALGLFYYITRKGSSKEMNPEIVKYITSHIKQGKKYPQIKQHLLKAGWQEKDIDWAYKQTVKNNYQKYLQTKGGKSAAPKGSMDNKKKVAMISIFSILLVIGIILMLNGVTTGKAIHFESAGELEKSMKNSLEKNLEDNPFYSLINYLDLCVQVVDENNEASFRVVKTPKRHLIKESKERCDYNNKNNFAVKFNSWEAFDLISNNPTCSNIKALHLTKKMYVLPSRYILDGFTPHPNADLTKYCKTLKVCMTPQDISKLDIGC
jgi:hypothetical protein